MEAYEKALADGVVVLRPDRGLLRLTGPQAVWFLQQTVTADVENVEVGRWTESAFLTPKGKLIAHFRVGIEGPETAWIDVDPPSTGELADWFTKNRFRTKVEIEDRSVGAKSVLGPPALELAGPGQIVVDGDTVIFGDALGDLAVADVHGELALDLLEAPLDIYETFRIEAGVAKFGVDYTTDNLPQEGGLSHVTPIDRGCYVGQETVARIFFRGHINKVVRPLHIQGTVAALGRDLAFDDQVIGRVTSVAVSPRLGSLGIGMVRGELPEGTEVQIDGGGTAALGPVPAGTKLPSSR